MMTNGQLLKETGKEAVLIGYASFILNYKELFDSLTSLFALLTDFIALIVAVIRFIKFIQYLREGKENGEKQ
jgi:hypothetical protein